MDAADAELDAQAQVMAEKALEKLPENIRATKIAKVKEGILKRLKAQAEKAASGAPVQAVGAPATAPPPPEGPPPPPQPEEERRVLHKCEGIEALGDEDWFADLSVRRALREGVVAAHAENKILVSSPATEIKRIWPGGGRVVMAGAVLRLGGALMGGYGEPDIAYAYRQLSRALHPDKNPDVPEAHDAFKRLKEAKDELTESLNDARNVLRLLLAAMGGTVTNEMLERPQEALMAESSRLLFAILGLAGEGEVSPTALTRAVTAFGSSSTFFDTAPQALLSQFFDMNSLLDFYAGQPLRTAYDCSKKRFRAQFLCALNRVTGVEAKRQSDCIRGNWQEVMMQFPELGLWKELLDKLKGRVWAAEGNDEEDGAAKKRSKWDAKDDAPPVQKPSEWAKRWRKIMKAVLPRGIDGAMGMMDPELRKMGAALWVDVVAWANETGAERALGLFSSEPVRGPDGNFMPAEDQWCYVPAVDLLLIVGDGVVGTTVEGMFADNRPGHEPLPYEEALVAADKKEEEKEERGRSKSRSRSKSKSRKEDSKDGNERDHEKRKQEEDFKKFDWENEWRNRTQKRRRARSYDRNSPPARDRWRSRSRDRRRRSRSGGRRRSRSGKRSRRYDD